MGRGQICSKKKKKLGGSKKGPEIEGRQDNHPQDQVERTKRRSWPG